MNPSSPLLLECSRLLPSTHLRASEPDLQISTVIHLCPTRAASWIRSANNKVSKRQMPNAPLIAYSLSLASTWLSRSPAFMSKGDYSPIFALVDVQIKSWCRWLASTANSGHQWQMIITARTEKLIRFEVAARAVTVTVASSLCLAFVLSVRPVQLVTLAASPWPKPDSLPPNCKLPSTWRLYYRQMSI